MFKCNICDKQFKYKSEHQRHKNNKKPCDNKNLVCKNFECIKCDKMFTTK